MLTPAHQAASAMTPTHRAEKYLSYVPLRFKPHSALSPSFSHFYHELHEIYDHAYLHEHEPIR